MSNLRQIRAISLIGALISGLFFIPIFGVGLVAALVQKYPVLEEVPSRTYQLAAMFVLGVGLVMSLWIIIKFMSAVKAQS